MTKYVLVTGAAGGIGLALTKVLVENGFSVIAGVHHTSGLKILADLNSKNILPILLDVTDQTSIKKQFAELDPLLKKEGLYGLVNNAGVALTFPLEFFPLDLLNKQFQVNTLGVVAITQVAMPYLRKATGKIINIGSTMGRYTMPFVGGYSASKFALRALSQAMRVELKPWGIGVTYIEAGGIKTPIVQKGTDILKSIESNTPGIEKYYGAYAEAMIKVPQEFYKYAIDPAKVGKKVLNCLTKDKLKAIYVIGMDAWIAFLLNKFISAETLSTMVTYFLDKKINKR